MNGKLRGYYLYARLLAFRQLLYDRFDESCVYVLTSSTRSGSTLLGQVLSAIPRSGVLFEPLHPEMVPESAAGFGRCKYVRPDAHWPEGEAFLRDVFHGRVVNGWLVREMSLGQACLARRLIVKFVRANRLLPWMCNRFALPSPVLLLRHPCAVIASQMTAGWALEERPEAPEFLDAFPAFQAALAATEGIEEFTAARWALDQLPALLQPRPHPWTVVTYEELMSQPEPTIRRICEGWKIDLDMNKAIKRLKRPSSVVARTGIRRGGVEAPAQRQPGGQDPERGPPVWAFLLHRLGRCGAGLAP